MWQYPSIDPVAFSIGPLQVHWYGLMYLISFISCYLLCQLPWRRERAGLSRTQVGDLIIYGAFGVIIGGRVGYMLFYQWSVLLSDPLSLLRIWEGGMSFHGGLLGVILSLYIYARKYRIAFFSLTDFIAPVAPIGLAAGRLGNFINGELWGRYTDVPWAVLHAPYDSVGRHPSVLYEFALEGVLLFCLLWWFALKPRPRMQISGLFLFAYGVIRFSCEFYRQPDAHLGFVLGEWMTQGQLLSIPMLLLGVILIALTLRRSNHQATNN
jgi:phosphatidylglycerol:prolipoprotein diacylglycerol transferase